jgi:hypothetical protein
MMTTVKNIILITAEIKMYLYDTIFGFRQKYCIFSKYWRLINKYNNNNNNNNMYQLWKCY